MRQQTAPIPEATDMRTALQAQDSEVLHEVPIGATYEEIIGALED